MLEDYTPEEIQKFWLDLITKAEAAKPPDAKEKKPEALAIYEGDCWAGVAENERPEIVSSVNMVYAAWKSLLPQVMTREPKPACISPTGNTQYAELHNTFKAYRDKELGMIEVDQDILFDTFIRGTGCARHDRDPKRGMSRTSYCDVTDVLWDHNARRPTDAKHLIEVQEVYRWEFSRRFGKELGYKIKADVASPTTAKMGEPNPFDRIKYYLCWSKHEEENRIYAIHKEFAQEYLNVGKDGMPGDPFPFVLDDDEWHITPLLFNSKNDSPWGMGYYRAVRGPVCFMQFVVSYILAAAKKSCLQAVAVPNELSQFAEKLAGTRKHLEFLKYDPAELQGRRIEDLVTTLEFPDLHASMFKAMDVANSVHDKVSGFNAIQQGDAGAVETAAESVRMSDVAENRVAEDLRKVGAWKEKCFAKEVQIDCKLTPKRSVVCVKYDGPYDESEEPPEGVMQTSELEQKQNEQVIPDVPYQQAILLERGVGDPQSAQNKIQAFELATTAMNETMAETQPIMQQSAMVGQPPPPEVQQRVMQAQQMMQQAQLDPEIQVRQQYQIPLGATVEIIEPGLEAFVGPGLAEFWTEGMTDREIKAELLVRIEQGSTRRLGHLQKWNELLQAYSTFGGFFVEWQLFPQLVTLHNAMIDALESFSLDGMKITQEQLQAFIQQQQQQAIQQQQMAQQQEQQAQQQEAQSKQDLERQKAQGKAESEDNRESRDRRKGLDKAMTDAMKQGAAA